MISRRTHFRYYLPQPLKASMFIHRIRDHQIITKPSPIYILNICGGGLCFISPLRFPVTEDIEYEFLVTLAKHNFELKGGIVRRNGLGSRGYEYGVQFTEEQKYLIYIIKQLTMKIFGKKNYAI